MDTSQHSLLLLGASVVMGVAAAACAFFLLQMSTREIEQAGPAWEFESRRRARIRSSNSLYRWCEPLIDEVTAISLLQSVAARRRLDQELTRAHHPVPFSGAEFLALKQVEAVFLAIAVLVAGGIIWGAVTSSLLAAAFLLFVYPWLSRRFIANQAAARILRFKQRLPFAIDLITLMMGAGATFRDSLQTIVRENADHPLGEEFGAINNELELGRGLVDTLASSRDRLDDPDFTQFVTAVIQGEELGTPLVHVLELQAEQLRLKRSQWAEKAAGEAEVKILFPGMLIMVACLVLVTAIFLLPLLNK